VASAVGRLDGTSAAGAVWAPWRALLADLAWSEREALSELDVNPIVVRAEGRGGVALDALIVPLPDAQGA
jgi:hypothetical protein